MSEKQSVDFSGSFNPGEAAAYLEALARGLRDGNLVIESGDKSLNLDVSPEISLEFEAKASPEKGKSSIELALSWRAAQPVKEEAPPSLLIASGVAVASERGEEEYRSI
jgi:amphi-Trp domain-containing protein